MIIYRPSDRIPVKLDKYTVHISPLTVGQKAKIMNLTRMRGGQEVPDSGAMALETLKASIKGVDGLDHLTYRDGTKIELTFNDSGELDDDSLDVLIQVFSQKKLIDVATKIISNDYQSLDKSVEVKGSGSKVKKK